MAQLQLNKSSLAREQTQLRSYERFLPSLDLKRQQLMAARNMARAEAKRLEQEAEALAREAGETVPMLGDDHVGLDGLVKLTAAHIGTENLVGTRLPVLERIEVTGAPYSAFARPHWVDEVARLLHDVLEVQVRAKVAQRRVALLDRAVDKVTQRVNLFDKVLIPRAKANIKRIRIYLEDQQMSGVVRSKIAKRKRAEASQR